VLITPTLILIAAYLSKLMYFKMAESAVKAAFMDY